MLVWRCSSLLTLTLTLTLSLPLPLPLPLWPNQVREV